MSDFDKCKRCGARETWENYFYNFLCEECTEELKVIEAKNELEIYAYQLDDIIYQISQVEKITDFFRLQIEWKARDYTEKYKSPNVALNPIFGADNSSKKDEAVGILLFINIEQPDKKFRTAAWSFWMYDDMDNNKRIYQEEIFGDPVIAESNNRKIIQPSLF